MRDVFRTRARTFWFAARFLPPDRRAAVAGLYAFARAVDDLVDQPPPSHSPAHVRAVLAAWRDWLQRPSCSAAPEPSLAAGLMPALVTYGVPGSYLQLLVDGVLSDVGRQQMPSWPALRAYCVQVASSVGLAMCHLLGAGQDPLAREAAVALGIAMQLTNVLRDVGEDLEAGRVYLPADDLAEYGYSRQRLLWLAGRVREDERTVDDAFRDLMRGQIARARDHYARGVEGVWRLPAECRLSILLAARLYAAILDEIEAADYDVFSRRAATSTWRKLAEALACLAAPRHGGRLAAASGPPEPAWSTEAGASLGPGALPVGRP